MSKLGSAESRAWGSREIAAALTGAGSMVASGVKQLNLEGRYLINPKTVTGLVLAVSQLLNLPSCTINTENPVIPPTSEPNSRNASGLDIEIVQPGGNLTPDQQKELTLVNSLFIQAAESNNLTFPKQETDLDNPLRKGNLTEVLSTALNKPVEDIDVKNVNPAFLPKIIKFGEEKLIIQPVVYTNDDGQEQIVMFGSGNGADWGLVGLTSQPFDVFSSPGNGVVVEGISQVITTFLRNSAVSFTGLLVMGGENGAVFSQVLYFKADDSGKLQLVLRDQRGTLSGAAEENTPLISPQKDGLLNVAYTDNPVVPPTPELIPTETPNVPMIEVIDAQGNKLLIPDPKASNPEFFNLTSPDSPIVQFANAFGVKPEEVGSLTPQLLTGIDGKQFVVLTTGDLTATANFDESGTPLLIAEQGEGGEWEWSDLNSKIAANKRNINLGVLVGLYPGSPDFNKLQEVQSKFFNTALINVEWGNLQPTSDPINFNKSGVDWSVDFAQKNKMGSLGISLVWGADAPNWLKSGGFSKEQLTKIMTDHIKEVMTRYKGKIGAWIVVNEPYFPPYRTDDVFYKVIGPDYIEIAFKAAREADPSATLIYNDTLNHTSSGLTTDLTKKTVEELKTKNLIDAVGLQMHLDGAKPPNKEDLIATMKNYGLPIFITEFDVNMKDVGGTPEERAQKQAEIYKTVIEAAIESGVCNDIFVFQVGDKFSVWENFPGQGFSKNADPTPFDDNFQTKPAYYALVKAISNVSGP